MRKTHGYVSTSMFTEYEKKEAYKHITEQPFGDPETEKGWNHLFQNKAKVSLTLADNYYNIGT